MREKKVPPDRGRKTPGEKKRLHERRDAAAAPALDVDPRVREEASDDVEAAVGAGGEERRLADVGRRVGRVDVDALLDERDDAVDGARGGEVVGRVDSRVVPFSGVKTCRRRASRISLGLASFGLILGPALISPRDLESDISLSRNRFHLRVHLDVDA